ncbi:MAG: plasmid mobilization protein [Agriterribacter sp.]
MKDKNKTRIRMVGIRFTEKEYEGLLMQCKKTTTPIMSECIRRILFNKPIIVKQRNQSLDDFMAEMIRLRVELNHLGNNFNQAVKKLHTLIQLSEFRIWISTYEDSRKKIHDKIETIEKKIAQISDKWLQ